jgi:predicted metalloendopeptidase
VTTPPCHDFFQFACGNWNKKHMIPEDRASISTFEVLSDQIQLILKGKKSNSSNRNFRNSARPSNKLLNILESIRSFRGTYTSYS